MVHAEVGIAGDGCGAVAARNRTGVGSGYDKLVAVQLGEPAGSAYRNFLPGGQIIGAQRISAEFDSAKVGGPAADVVLVAFLDAVNTAAELELLGGSAVDRNADLPVASRAESGRGRDGYFAGSGNRVLIASRVAVGILNVRCGDGSTVGEVGINLNAVKRELLASAQLA